MCALEAGGRALLASGGIDDTVRLWDPVTGEVLATLEGHPGGVNAGCALEAGGRALVASGGDDGTVRLWDPATGKRDLFVPVGHEVFSIAPVDGGLALGLSAGVLVLDIPAPATDAARADGPEESNPLDLFISYTQPDRRWAEWIAWELEAAGHAVALQAWDFRPGSDFVAEMETALVEADRVLAVLSPAYVASAFAMAEWRATFAADPEGRTQRLIPVRVADFRPPGLHATRVYVDLVGADEVVARAALLAAVRPGRTKPDSAPPFPGRPAEHAPTFPGPA